LENEHSARTKHITVGKATATMDALKQQCKYFPNIVWWEGVVKKQIRIFFMREGTEVRRDAREMENFYYACLYN